MGRCYNGKMGRCSLYIKEKSAKWFLSDRNDLFLRSVETLSTLAGFLYLIIKIKPSGHLRVLTRQPIYLSAWLEELIHENPTT